jgi:O-antigen/teichoic acid export membrane protein
VVADQGSIIAIFVVVCAGYCLQFPARGVLAATRRFRGYATVVTVEALVRALVAVVLWAVGETSVWLFAAAVGGSALLAGVVGVGLIRRDGSTRGGQQVTDFGRDSARLVVAASSMQTLLNSGTLVAKFLAAPAQATFAGQLLAVITIARLPVLVFQSLQSVYVSRLARGWHLRDSPEVRHLLGVLMLLAGSLAALLVAGAAVIGTFVTRLVFGPDYAIDRTTCVLVALGVAVYLVAAVASDSSIAVGMHTLIVSAWVAGLLVGVVVAIWAPTLLTKATVPLIAGASLACVVLVVALVVRTRRSS